MARSILLLLLIVSFVYGSKVTIFAASDLRYALESIKSSFLQNHPNDKIDLIFGSSGKGRVQIERGAPYDLYFSANEEYVNDLYKKGYITTKPKLYAIGRLVIWSKDSHFKPKNGFENLKESWAKKIAIANPSHAPYGEKAKEALSSKGVYEDIRSKIVFGENISQTANFISTKSADIGIIALSLALSPAIKDSKYPDYYLIDAKYHQPLRQAYGITKRAKENKTAREFYQYLSTPKSLEILKKYGFSVSDG